MSRMDKYQNDTESSRLNRNKKLYDEVSDINIDYIDINYDNSVVINPKKIAKNKREDYHAIRGLDGYVPIAKTKEEYVEKPKEEKIYDIDEILKRARQNNLFEDDKKKRLINTEYNILSKLDIETIEKEDLSKEDLHSLIDTIYDNEEKKSDKPKKKKRANYDDDLMNALIDKNDDKSDIIMNTDIAKEILDNEDNSKVKTDVISDKLSKKDDDTDTTITYEIESKTKKDDSDKEKTYTGETEVTDRVLRNLDDTDTLDSLETKSKVLLIIIIIVVLALIAVGGYLAYRYFHI